MSLETQTLGKNSWHRKDMFNQGGEKPLLEVTLIANHFPEVWMNSNNPSLEEIVCICMCVFTKRTSGAKGFLMVQMSIFQHKCEHFFSNPNFY